MKAKHWFVFLLLGAIWSSSFMWIKIAIQEVGPTTLVAFRAFFGLLFGVVVIIFQRVPLPRTMREWSPLLVVNPTQTSMVTYLFPLGGVILGVTFLREQLTWQVIAGAALIISSLIVANWEPKKEEQGLGQQAASN